MMLQALPKYFNQADAHRWEPNYSQSTTQTTNKKEQLLANGLWLISSRIRLFYIITKSIKLKYFNASQLTNTPRFLTAT